MRNAQGMVDPVGHPEQRGQVARATRALALLLLGLCSAVAGGAAWAETFTASPPRVIGPYPGQGAPAPGGGWQASDNPTIGASIGGQGGWSVNCNAGNYDQEITAAVARSGQQSWRLSNWFHEGCVNTVLSPAFASVQEGVGPSSQIQYSFWFLVPSGNDGLTVSSSLTDAPGARLTYAALRDIGGSAHVQAVGIRQGSGFVNTLPAPFDDAGVEYDIRNSPSLTRGAWYRLTVQGSLVSGARNDDITYTIHDAGNVQVWSSGAMDSWEDAYLAGPFAPPGTKVTVTRLGWRIVENPDDPLNRNPSGTYALSRPSGVFIDDLAIAPGSGSGVSAGFESDRYVATTGTDAGNCSNPLAPCATIGYAVSQSMPYNTIHIASGRYEESVTIPATLDGLFLKGEGIAKPEIALDTGANNQRLVTVNGAEDVRIEGLAFAMDQSFVAEGILAMGLVDGLELVGNDFTASHSLPGQVSTFGRRNAIAVNLVPNTAGLPRVDGSFVTIVGNTVDGIAGTTLLRSGISMDAGVGLIRDNTIAAGTQDITVRFAGALPATPVKTVRIEGNTLSGRGLQIANPNATCTGIEIVGNDIVAPAAIGAVTLDDTTVLPADWNLVRLIHNSSNVPTLLHDNTFGGHRGHFRGVTAQNYRNLTLTDNTFTPAAGAADFVSLVLSNKELTGDTPTVPDAVAITALGNTFDGNGSGVAGRAVEFINDNDANGAATVGPLQFGAVGEENTFSPELRWYFALDGHHCDTSVALGGVAPECTFLNYNGVGTLQNTQVRPFRGDVDAMNNLFDGILPADMDAGERNALLARTRDDASNADLGVVDYGFAATQSATYVDATFAGAYGDEVTFTHDQVNGGSPITAHLGIDAFASVNDGIAHVLEDGAVYVGDGTYAETVAVNKRLQLIGNGIGNTTVISGSLDVTAPGVAGTPILFRDFIVTNPVGNALTLGGTVSHLRFEGVAFDDSSGTAVRFNGTGNDQIAFTGPGCRFRGNDFAVVTSTAAVASNISFDGCEFSGNNAGIVLFGGSGSAATGQIQAWSVANSQFTGNNDDSNLWGGALWLKTAGAGSAINGFTVTGSTFSDNGSTNTLNRTGITVRARTGATMAGVQICDNDFSETGAAGTQLTGINVYAQPGSVYTPIEVCANNTFIGLEYSVSGLEQFTATATEPVVNISGGSLLDWEHLYFPPAATVYVDDDFAGTPNGATVGFPGHLPAACAAANGTYGVDAFASVSEALANVQSGGTVCVADGAYVEPVLNIGAPVSLFGAQATVDARNRTDAGASIVRPAVGNPALSYSGPEALSLVNIASSDVVIDGFVFDGDNTGIATGLPMGAADPDVDSGIWASGSRIEIRNNVVRNLVYAGIEGYNADGSQPAREGNAIQRNWIHNIDAPSGWGLGIVVLWNYYADISHNLLTDVRVGVQTNYFFKTAPVPADASISDNTIHTSRLGIYHNFHNAAVSQSSPFVIGGNTIEATANPSATGGWTGIFLQTLQAASTATVTGNAIDATALAASGRLRVGYAVGQITSSLASSTAIDNGSVNAVDYGVLVTDGAFYGGPVDDIVVRGVDFSDVSIAAIHAEDTALAGSETVDNAVRVTVGPGNTFASDVAHHGALSGPLASIEFAPGADLFEKMLVRAAGDGHRGALPDSNGNHRTVAPGIINDAIADASETATSIVTVAAGTFAQNVVLDKDLTLAGPQSGIGGDGLAGVGEDAGARDGLEEAIISPATGRALVIHADGAVVDGLTFTGLDGDPNTVAIGSGGNFGGMANDVIVRNNRFVDLDATAIYTNGPTNLSGWEVRDNLFDGVGDPATNASAINLWKMDGATIAFNTVRDVAFGGIQLNTGTGNAVLDNRVENTGNNGINIGPGLSGVEVRRNVVVNANNDGSSPEEGALTVYAGSGDVEISCNVFDEGTAGVNALSTTDDVPGALGSNLRIFHNAVLGDIAHNIAGSDLLVGSNWYGGSPAPAPTGSGAAAAYVADALGATPIDDVNCGSNDPVAIAIHAGTAPQTTPINTAFADLQARVTDVLGGAVVGAAVTFDPPDSGALAVLGTASGNTDYNGVHRSTATANAVAGAYLVPASNDDAGSIDFALTNGKAVGTIELVDTSFPYTGGDHILAARIAEEPGTACTDITPATISDVGSHSIAVGACTGTNYDASATTLAATVTGENSVRRLRDEVLFDSVAAGLADPDTEDTDTLQMAPGVYSGPIVITRPITLMGSVEFTANKAGVTSPPSTVIDGGNAVADGVVVNPGVENVAIVGLEVRNVTNNCIASGAGANGLLVQDNLLHHCGLHGVLVSGIADIADVTIDHNEVHTFGGRGIVVWDGIKRDISITDNYVHNESGTGCCGIELQDGAATGVRAAGNVVENTGDSGMAFIQLTSGSPSGRANVIRNNTVTNTGRFGIEIKIPNGSGLDAGVGDLGDGAIVVEGNIIDGAGVKTLRDRAGIAVHRRSFGTYPFMVDATVGVIVRDNAVSGFRTNLAGYEGYGIVVEGLGSSVEGNILTGNDIGLQLQQANPSAPPGDSNQNAQNDWFGRGNAPLTCVGVGDNTITGSTLVANRSVPASANLIGGVRNENTGTWYCSIQAAINAAATVTGHTLRVYPGTYAENVNLNKSLTLVGPHAGVHGNDPVRGTGEAIIQPTTGTVLQMAATGAVVDGLTLRGGTAGHAVNRTSGNGVEFINNRVLNVTNGSGITSEQGANCAVDGWLIAHNVFNGIAGGGAANGRGVRLGNGHCNVQIVDNDFGSIQTHAVQANGGSDTLQNITIADNRIAGISSNALVITSTNGTVIERNILTGVAQGLFIADRTSNFTASCNVISATGSGFSSADFFGNSPNSNVRIFDNSISGGTVDLNSAMAQGLIVGSNWYSGTAPAISGSAVALLVADPLPLDPTNGGAFDVANCGNNTPVDLVLYDGSPQAPAQLNQPFAEPLQARVIDQLGGAVMGQTVSFGAPTTGASAGLTPVSGSSQSSNYNGVVQVTAIANGFAGTYDVRAEWTTEFVDFSLTNAALDQVQLDLNGPVGGVEVGETVAYTGLILNDNDDVTENVYLTIDVAGSTLEAVPAPMALVETDVRLCVVNPGNPAQCLPIDFDIVGNHLYAEFPGDLVGTPIGTNFSIAAPYEFLHNLRVIYGQPGVYTATAQVVGIGGTVYAGDVISTEVIEQHAGVDIDLDGPITGVEKDMATDYSLRLVNTAADVADGVFVELVFTRDGGAWSPGEISVEQVGTGTLVLSPTLDPNVLTAVLDPSPIGLVEGYDQTDVLRITHGVADTFHIAATVRDVAGDTDGIDPYAADNHDVDVIEPDPDVSLTLSGVFDVADGETLVAAHVAAPVIMRGELVNTGGDVPGLVQASFTVSADYTGIDAGDIEASYWFVPIGDACAPVPAPGDRESVTFGDDGDTLSAVTTPQPLLEGMELAVCFQLDFVNAGVYNIGAVIEDSVDDQITYAADNLAITVADSDGVVTLNGLGTFVFNGADRAVTVDTTPPGLDYTLAYTYTANGAVTPESDPPNEAGTYVVTATIDPGQGYGGSASGTLTITPKPVTIVLGGDAGGTFIYDTTARTATAAVQPGGIVVGFPFGAPLQVTYNGVPAAPVDAGAYVVTASFDSSLVRNYVALPPISSIVILKAQATVTLGDLLHVYDGAPHGASVVVNPSGLDVDVTYDGLASAPSAVGNYSVVATVLDANHEGSAASTLSIVAAALDTVELALTGDATAVVDTAFNGDADEDVCALVTDVNGDDSPAGIEVAFSTPAAGASAVLSQTVALTDIDGLACVAATANTVAGDYAVTATVTGIAPATIDLSNQADTDPVQVQLAIVAGNGQTSPVGEVFPVALQVQARDRFGNALDDAGYAPTFTLPGAEPTASATAPVQALDGSWSVTATAGDFAGAYAIDASLAALVCSNPACAVSFGLSNTTAAPVDVALVSDVLTNVVGDPAGGEYALTATVTDAANGAGDGVSGVSVTFVVEAGANGAGATTTNAVDLTDANGVATASIFANSVAGGFTVRAVVSGVSVEGTTPDAVDLTNLAGPAFALEIASGNHQSVMVETGFETLAVRVVDESGNPVQGATVSFAATPAGNGASAVDLAAPVDSDEDGLAVSPATANAIAGSYIVTASATDLDPVVFNLSNSLGAIDITGIRWDGNDLAQIDYSGVAQAVTFDTDPPIDADENCDLSYNGGGAEPVNAGAYLVQVTCITDGFSGTESALLTIDPAAVSVTLGDLSQVYDGSAKAASFTTDPAGVTGVTLAYSQGGSPVVAPVNAGVYDIAVSLNNPNHTLEPVAAATLTITQAPLDVTLGDLSHIYNGAAKAASVATSPAGVAGVSLAYSQSAVPVAAPTDAGVYDIAVSLSNANYALGTVTPSPAQLTISTAAATIGFGASGPFVYTGQPQGPAVDSGGVAASVIYTGTTAAGVPYGPSATPPTDAGDYTATVTITDPNYSASPVAQGFSIAKAQAQVTLSNLIHVFDGSVKAALATTVPAGLTVDLVYAPATPQAVGSYDVTGTVDDANYQGSASAMLTILSAAISDLMVDGDTAVTGIAGAALAAADLPTVRVLDNNGDGVEGISVLFEPGADSGSATGTTVTTDSDGRATVGSWTLDADAGNDDTMTARVPGQAGLPVILFEATSSEEADVSVLKTSATASADRGDALTYTITVENSGPSNAGSVDVLDALPDGLDAGTATWVCLHTGAALCGDVDGSGDVDVGAFVPVGDSVVVTLTANVAAQAPNGALINTAAIELTSGVDANAANDSSSHTVTVAPRAPAIFADGFESDEEPAPAAAADTKAGNDALAWTPGWGRLGTRPGVLLDVRGQGQRVAALDGLRVGERAFVRIRQRGADGREGFGAWTAVDKAASLRFAWTLALDGAELHFTQDGNTALKLGLAPGQPLPARLRVLRAEPAGGR